MKFGQPLLSTQLSGKLGGVVGATARGGVGYFRRRVEGSNPQTPLQAISRSIMSTLSGTWLNTLTDSQRASWAAKAGAEESGIDVYVKANFQQLLAGAAATPTAPTSVALDDVPITGEVAYTIGDETLSVSLPSATNVQYNVYISRWQTPSRSAKQYPFSYLLAADAGDSEISIDSGTGPLAGITAGMVFYVRFVAFGNLSTKLGRVGQQQIFRVVAAA